ncbi:sensor histidine kinase [Streptomyces albidoflavus]
MWARPRRWPLRSRIGTLVTVLCACAMAATAAAWVLTDSPAVIVTTELAGLLVVALVSTLAVRREVRPLEDAAATSDAIAAGDLSRRVTAADTAPSTEVGRLAHALNGMLDQIQAALTAREESEARMRQFVADASHELRTPLQSLRGYIELYQHGALQDTATVDEAMARMHSEVRRMGRLVESLLTLARLDEESEARLGAVDLSRVVTDSCRDAAAVEPARPRSVRVRPGIIVLGDEAQLRGLLANLLGNVRTHTPPGTRYTVELRTEGDEAVLVVADEGPGIPGEDVARVFDRFYRADKARSRARGGSGLGLAISAAVADRHHARIRLDSTPGKGTRVTVRFPHSTRD